MTGPLRRLRDRRPRIVFVADDLDWVQGARLEQLRRHLPDLRFDGLSIHDFADAWSRGGYRRRPVYFGSWRSLASLTKNDGIVFASDDLSRFMVSVTSHYNLGGGLAPSEAVPRGMDPAESLAAAVALLRGCAVVTVNSTPLLELLADHVPDLVYAPNGVDVQLFRPPERVSYDSARIRFGWIGKLKAAKNFDTLRSAAGTLAREGFAPELLALPKSGGHDRRLDGAGMKAFYHRIDYYVCASWHEGTPNPALEAAACGVPVVTTRVGNMPDLIRHGENGFLIEPTVESIVATFRTLRSLDVAEYQRLRAAARRSIEDEWAWAQRVETYRAAFSLLLERSGAADATLAR